MRIRQALAGARVWAGLMACSAFRALWTLPALAALAWVVVAPALLLIKMASARRAPKAPIPRWEQAIMAFLEALGAAGLEGVCERMGSGCAQALRKRPELAPFARAAGWNPAALALFFGPMLAERDDPEALAGSALERLGAWTDELSPLAADWRRPCGRASALWWLSPKKSVEEEALRHWSAARLAPARWGVDPAWDSEARLIQAMRAAAERAELGLGVGAPARLAARGRL